MKKRKRLIEPSILSGDFGHLADEAKRVEEAGADALHIDIMDGHFVPNLSFGPNAVAAINRATDLFLDVHLMIYNPYDYIERFVEAGADRITFHLEATEDVEETLDYIHKCNIEAGLALRPETPCEMVFPYIGGCELILVMTVNPGFGGQPFLTSMLEKVSVAKEMIDRANLGDKAPHIQVDGGIDDTTAIDCAEAGANVLVSGTYLFKTTDMESRIKTLRVED